jgi:ubiquinone/menaquinone biosynthesis C-methylase UbiE
MKRSGASDQALNDPRGFYDARFSQGYMHGFDYDVYERARVRTVRGVLKRLQDRGLAPASILDYGCGEGRYIGELKKFFPNANLTGCDISEVGLEIAGREQPTASFLPMQDETIPAPDSAFDFVISIEVLEHVADVGKAVNEIARVMKPGALALITTPCANKFSGEWLRMAFTKGFEPSADGFGRFCTDEPGHLRRLTDRHLRDLFRRAGVDVEKIFHRSHLFTPIVEQTRLRRRIPIGLREKIAMLDWHLFKHLPNGSTLLAICRKADAATS